MGRGRPHKCPYCEATKSVAKGFRYNKAGKVRLRRCKECGRRWTVGTVQEEGMTEPPQPITIESQENPTVLHKAEVAEHEEARADDQPTTRTNDGNLDDGDPEEKNRIELSLSGEESPNHEDSGEERLEEAEDTFLQH